MHRLGTQTIIHVLKDPNLLALSEVLLLQEAGKWDIDAVAHETQWSALCNTESGRDVAIFLRGSSIGARAWTGCSYYFVMAVVE